MTDLERLSKRIRSIPDFPKKGIDYKDITPILSDSDLCRFIIDDISNWVWKHNVEIIAGIESRGFLFGMSLAQKLGLPFVPVRKKGKLPYKTISTTYELEYGSDEIEMHVDAFQKGQRIHIHDDLLATGGTAAAVAEMIHENGGEVAGFSFLIELEELNGRQKLRKYNELIRSLVKY